MTHLEHLIIRFSTSIEQHRYLILNKDSASRKFYNSLTSSNPFEEKEKVFRELSAGLYERVKFDSVISHFFAGVNLED